MATQIFNDNIQLNANKALDNRTGIYNGSSVWTGYTNTTTANAALDPAERHQGLTVLIQNGPTIDEYWYKDGIADNQLILKNTAVFTSDNGLTKTGSNFQLGGTLLHDTTIDNSTFSLNMSGTKPNGIVLDVSHSSGSGGGAIRATDNTGVAFQATTLSGRGINVNTGTGVGVSVSSTSGTCYSAFNTGGGNGADFVTANPIVNTVLEVLRLGRQKYGTLTKPSVGFGSSIATYLEVDDTGESVSVGTTLASNIDTVWTNAVQAARTSKIDVSVINNGAINKVLTLAANKITLPKYGTGAITGTVAKLLGVTSAGDVVETTAGTVASFAFTNGNGFDGTVANSTTTPTLSLTTTLTTNSVPYISSTKGLTESNANFTFDDVIKRLAITNGDMFSTGTVNNPSSATTKGYFGNTINWTGNVSQSAGNSYNGLGTFLNTIFNGDMHVNAASVHSSNYNLLRIGSSSSSAITVDWSGGTRRAISANGAAIQISTIAGGNTTTFSDIAAFQVYAPSQTDGSSVTSIPTITNYYGLLIADQGEYTNVVPKITNRYSIYQAGQNDINYFNGHIVHNGIKTYASDAAADADTSLPSKAFYKLTGNRALYQKP